MKKQETKATECSVTLCDVRFVHRIHPLPTDVLIGVRLASRIAIDDRKSLGKALRDAHVMGHGHSICEMRREGADLVVFPRGQFNVWHSIILSNFRAA